MIRARSAPAIRRANPSPRYAQGMTASISVTFDPTANAAYVTLGEALRSEQSAAQHVVDLPAGAPGEVILDFDNAGRLIGVEVLGAREMLRPEVIAKAPTP